MDSILMLIRYVMTDQMRLKVSGYSGYLGRSAKDGASGACPTFPKLAIADEYCDNKIHLPSFSDSIAVFLTFRSDSIACCSVDSLNHYELHTLSSPRHARPSSRTPHPTINTTSAQCRQQ
jgi:hypothetical protein